MKPWFLLLLFWGVFCSGQDYSDNWEAFFSYNDVVDIERSGNFLYVAAENSILIYNTQTEQYETITTLNGLDGDFISQIHYSLEYNVLMIGYGSGKLQVYRQDQEILNVVDIEEQQSIPPDRKRVNEFMERDGIVYIATDFGVALYDIQRLEFGDTYFIGDGGARLRVEDLIFSNGFIYAASSQGGGIRRASLDDPFLIDFTNWQTVNTGSFEELVAFGPDLYAYDSGDFQFIFNGSNFIRGRRYNNPIQDVTALENRLAVIMQDRVEIYDLNLTIFTTIDRIDQQEVRYNTGVIFPDAFYAGTRERGLARVDLNNPTDIRLIDVDGPLLNTAFAIEDSPNELWVVYGDHNIFYNPFPLDRLGASHLTGDSWQNFSYDELFQARSIGSVTIDPEDPSHVYLNSMYDGIVEIREDQPFRLIDNRNSTLNSVGGVPGEDIRVPESMFDGLGNLWALNSLNRESLHVLRPESGWEAIDVGSTINSLPQDAGPTKMVITDRNRMIFGSVDNGVIAYDPERNSFGQLMSQPGEGGLGNTYVSALAIDQTDQLWIGSNLGLNVLFNVSTIFNQNTTDARPIVIEDESGIPRELLEDQAILDIEVDGNNNKWIGTASSGVYLFSPDGQETIYQFTKSNSPLPSNQVRDVEVASVSGLVYFATDRGIVALRDQPSSEPQEDLSEVYAFPNPVRPDYDGSVVINNLTRQARVKITDIQGNLVYEEVSSGGSIQWDTRSFGGRKVRSGVYMILVNTEDTTDTKVTKVMIIR